MFDKPKTQTRVRLVNTRGGQVFLSETVPTPPMTYDTAQQITQAIQRGDSFPFPVGPAKVTFEGDNDWPAEH